MGIQPARGGLGRISGLFGAVWGVSCALALFASQGSQTCWAADAVPLTIFHTNDLHSHFRGEKTPLGLGGVARLKTAITRARASVQNSLFVDGGDWSEGNIYYNEGAGRETLRMMDHLGYDVAVVGNHDWLNGAGTLLEVANAANPSLKLIASNVETADYPNEAEFRRRILPYAIQEIGGIKVAFIGLLTYEFIYDKFLKPIKITEPFAATRELAARLKKQADLVVVISHNSIKLNQGVLLAAPDVDLLIGAHDHVKLTAPVVVKRPGHKDAWIVEAGCWGRYLGHVNLLVHPRDGQAPAAVELVNYGLQQMDRTVPEDPATLSKIASLEAVIEGKRGPIFHDRLGESQVELARGGQENLMGDFATDAYLSATRADLSIDQTNFIYNEIHRGDVSTVDVFNSNPGVYDPRTDKAWTIHLIPIQGKTLSWVMNLLYSSKALSQQGALNLSGADVVYHQPMGGANTSRTDNNNGQIGPGVLLDFPQTLALGGSSIASFKIRGQDLQADRTYVLAAPGGVVDALEFLASLMPGAVPLDQMKDTGLEDWRVMADYLAAHSPITETTIPFGRIHTVQPDLGVLYDDIRWEPSHRDPRGRMLARVTVRVRNTGMRASIAGTADAGPRLRLLLNTHGVDYSIDSDLRDAAAAQGIPSIAPGASADLSWDSIAIPETLGVFALAAQVVGNDKGDAAEINHSNDWTTRYFEAPAPTVRLPKIGPVLVPQRPR